MAIEAETSTALSAAQLSADTGMSVRTIRFYQSEGLLPPPVREGRAARYGAAHLERLRLIIELQGRGLRLSAIAELLRQATDESAAEWLGLGESLSRPWSEDHPVLLSEEELGDRLGDAPAGTAEGLVRSGVVERRADTTPVVYLVPSPGLLDLAVALGRLGIDVDTGARLRDLLQRRLRAMANDLVAEFTSAVSLARLAEEGPGGLARLLDQLQPLTRRSVDLLFTHEMERAQRELLESAGSDLASPTQ